MRVYVTKYALTKGIFAIDADVKKDDRPASKKPELPWKGIMLTPGQWFETEEDAKARAEYMRKRELISLERKTRRLRELRFN